MPIAGKTILLTRAAAQSGSLRNALEALGAEVLELPTIEIIPPDDWREVDRTLQELSTFTWIVFASQNAVNGFCGRVLLTALPKVAAIGRATATRLRQLGISVDLVPRLASAQSLLDELPMDLEGESFLIPRGNLARETLPEGLRQRGARVETVTVYRTVVPATVPQNVLDRLLNGAVDLVMFTSPSTVENLQGLLDAPLADVLRRCAVAAIGSTTADFLRNMGIPVHVQPPDASAASFASAAAAHFETAN